jgi:hypothetical protein
MNHPNVIAQLTTVSFPPAKKTTVSFPRNDLFTTESLKRRKFTSAHKFPSEEGCTFFFCEERLYMDGSQTKLKKPPNSWFKSATTTSTQITAAAGGTTKLRHYSPSTVARKQS